MNIADIRRAIADEKAAIDAAQAAVAEAREALERAERDERETVLRSESRILALETLAERFGEGHAETPLHNPRKNASLNPRMDTEKHARPRGQRLKTKHVGAVRIRKVDGSINAFAVANKLPPTTVYGWFAKGESARQIPAKWADRLEKKPYEIPRSAWTNGILSDGE